MTCSTPQQKGVGCAEDHTSSALYAVLDRNGLVKRRKRRRHKAQTPLSGAHAPNGLWCADYKRVLEPPLLLPLPSIAVSVP